MLFFFFFFIQESKDRGGGESESGVQVSDYSVVAAIVSRAHQEVSDHWTNAATT